MFPRVLRALIPLAVLAAALLPVSAAASPPPAPMVPPVHRDGSGWFTCQHDTHANVAGGLIVRNNSGQPMCIGSYDWGDDFTVYHSSVTESWQGFPNIYSGCEMSGNWPQLCTRGYRPVQVSRIRSDVSSVQYFYPQRRFRGNAAYDIWFNQHGGWPEGRDDGAEIMIWLGSAGIGRPAYWRTVRIDGIWWGYDTWTAGRFGHSWNYVRYWRLSGWTPRSAARLDLVPFFRDAEVMGRLSSRWYLTGTEFGFETCHGGRGLRVKDFSDKVVTR